MKRIIFTAALAIVLVSCYTRGEDLSVSEIPADAELFVKKELPGVFNDGVRLYELDKSSTQMVWSKGAKSFTLLDDDLSKRITVTLGDSEYQYEGNTIDVEVVTSGIDGVTGGTKSVQVLKGEGDLLWLWNADEKIGYLIYTDL